MIGPVEKKPSIRIAGYLEKRGKMKLLVCRWKRWWFVLEGRLLLYYKSQLEYINLSPCRGSLNMGLASSVHPGKGLELTVITRSQSVTLRASSRVDHEQWLQSLVDAMALPNSVNVFSSRPVMHFRYSSQDHKENIMERIKNFRCPTYTAMTNENSTTQTGSCEMSSSSSHSSGLLRENHSDKCMLRRVFSDSRTMLRRPCKRNNSLRTSVRLSKIAFSDTSIPVSSQAACLNPVLSTDKCHSLQELRNSIGISDDNVLRNKLKNKSHSVKHSAESTKALKESKENKSSNSITIALNLENMDSKNGEKIKEQKIGNVKIVLDGCAIYESNELNKQQAEGNNSKLNGKSICNYIDYKNKRRSTLQSNFKEAKSDTDLAVRRKIRGQSLSCENVQTLDRSIGSTYHDITQRLDGSRTDEMSYLTSPDASSSISSQKTKKKRSHSILSRFRDSKAETEGGTLERRGTIKKRLSFLKKVWKKKEKRAEDDIYGSNDYESIPVVIELPNPAVEKAEDLLLSLERQGDCGPEPEPPPDYDISLPEELEVPPLLPPRTVQRPSSPWHDIPKNNQPVLPAPDNADQKTPPPLPLKKRHKNSHQVLIKITQEPNASEQTQLSSLGGESVVCEPPSSHGEQNLEDLDTLLAQLSEVNTYVVRQIDVSQNFNDNIVQVSAAPEPDYDVPRPHISLLGTLRTQHARSDTFTPTHFLCTTPLVDSDSLDPIINKLDAEMTPDSLECESGWSMAPCSEALRYSDSSHSSSLLSHFITTEDKPLPDSLNS